MPHLSDRVSIVGCGSWHGLPAYSRGNSCNVFVLDGGSELAMFDIGDPKAVPDVLRNMRREGLDPAKLKKIFITHAHDDHTSGITELLKHVDAKVYGHKLTRETLRTGKGIYHPGFCPTGHINGPVHNIVKDGDSVRVGDLVVKVIGCPGHSPDGLSYCFPVSKGQACFTGDTAIGDQPMHKGVLGLLNFHWWSKLTDYRKSLERLQSLELAAMFTGHGNSQLTRKAVKSSLKNCLAELASLKALPSLGWLVAME